MNFPHHEDLSKMGLYVNSCPSQSKVLPQDFCKCPEGSYCQSHLHLWAPVFMQDMQYGNTDMRPKPIISFKKKNTCSTLECVSVVNVTEDYEERKEEIEV